MKKDKIWQYGLATAVALAMAAGVALWKGLPEAEGLTEILGILTDAFTIPGVLFAGLGALSLIRSRGGYDSFGYMFSKFSLHNLLPTRQEREAENETYYDYKVRKDEQGRKWLPHILYVGLAFLAVSLLLLATYLTVS